MGTWKEVAGKLHHLPQKPKFHTGFGYWAICGQQVSITDYMQEPLTMVVCEKCDKRLGEILNG